MKLLTKGSSALKTAKSDKAGLGYNTYIMYLAPHSISGNNVCPSASEGCKAACLYKSGYGYYQPIQQARINRTKFFFNERDKFWDQLITEIRSANRSAQRKGNKLALRLNGTSDLPWERLNPDMFLEFHDVQFYDYTKVVSRAIAYGKGDMPNNYHITFSKSEINQDKCLEVLRAGTNVAVVFDNKELPKYWKRFPVHNADTTDLRFLDPFGVQGLYPKGEARKDTSGFVVPTQVRQGKRVAWTSSLSS